MRLPLIVGNWKMNGSRATARELAAGIAAGAPEAGAVEVAVCPPFVYLADAVSALADTAVAVGAQNVADREPGAVTGEVAGGMLRDVGCRYAIVGHSERRTLYGESDELVAARFAAARRCGLTPILCVGETLSERDAGDAEAVLARQIGAVLDAEGGQAFREAAVAYEPVWAIGTGRTATPEQAQAAHAFIRDRIALTDPEAAAALRLLYGGSMKPDNAGALLAMPDVDGGLIGGASLEVESFLTICRAAADRR